MSSDASSLMGPLLLKGWGMQADSCDECQVPRMESRALKASVCCGCEGRLSKLIVDGCTILSDGPLLMI